MVVKVILLVAVLTCQVLSLTETRLDDLNVHYIRHPLIGTSFTIPLENFDDTLISCNIVFPNNVAYTVFPTANYPTLDFMTMPNVQPMFFQDRCTVAVRNVGTEYSGVYELIATKRRSADNSNFVIRRRFNLQVVESDFS